MTARIIQPAHNPELFHSRSNLRPLSNKEIMQRARAVSANRPSSTTLACTGEVFIGMFFDGTGNNEDADYTKVKDNPAEQKPSNVVRLYHAFPERVKKGTSKFYRYYIPGVGTPFPQIGDSGGMVGTGASWNGEPRLIWGLTRIFNTVSDFVSGNELIDDALSGTIANATGGLGSIALQREHVFRSHWGDELKKKIANTPKDKPKLEQINLSVFGFSRGAAEARAFVNWLYALCDEVDGAYLFCGVPLRVDFLGIFDTVASVGIAGGFTDGMIGFEGHQSWAKDNMQVHKGVESCLHFVAAHEVRATFPLDSVRIDGIYPPNVKEYVYPGAHSDIGGGYHPKAQGKTDTLARIPCFEMYCAARAAGVPFLGLDEMNGIIKQALVPSQAAVDMFTAYCSAANVKAGPVEEMMRQHMAHYFTYRYQARTDPVNNPGNLPYVRRAFFKKTVPDQESLRDTQQHFIAILAALACKLEHIMKSESSYDSYVVQPFQSEGSYLLSLAIFGFLNSAGARGAALKDSSDNGDRDKQASQIRATVKKWRAWLNDQRSPDLLDAGAPERDILTLVSTLSDIPQTKEIVQFFDEWVHDSMAGLAKQHVNEFLVNGIGLAKFRRVFFGNHGDAMLHEAAQEINAQRVRIADAQRKQRKQWDLEAQEFRRAN